MRPTYYPKPAIPLLPVGPWADALETGDPWRLLARTVGVVLIVCYAADATEIACSIVTSGFHWLRSLPRLEFTLRVFTICLAVAEDLAGLVFSILFVRLRPIARVGLIAVAVGALLGRAAQLLAVGELLGRAAQSWNWNLETARLFPGVMTDWEHIVLSDVQRSCFQVALLILLTRPMMKRALQKPGQP